MPCQLSRALSLSVLVFCAALVGPAMAADAFLRSNYDEKYRGQFHFSQQSGWMNDINGLWFYNGTYYLTYQTTPNSTVFDFSRTSWGMATSPDLLHWTQKPVIAEPDAVQGTPMSGSTVIDVNNTSGLKTGSNPVFVSMHSTDKVGDSLFYSNDLGVTWTKYQHNPVIPGGAFPRDPHVFWHAPIGKWVMVKYGPGDTGTSIWNSPNLISWTNTSIIPNLGHECADLFPLTVNGTQKWVLWAGDSSYLIGDFDGASFRPDAGGPYLLNRSAFFYAAQTFNIASLPTPRVIQLGWAGNPDLMGGSTQTPEDNVTASPWSQNATFPTELQLRNSPVGVRLAANPISEIASLYTSTSSWSRQALASGSNLLSDTRSKSFDMSVEFDLSGATASQIVLRIANRSLVYDVASQTLDGLALAPIGNKLTLRVLADWGQLEVFGNDGLFYNAQRFAFTPSDTSLALTASNGSVTINAMSFHDVGRTWPGRANPLVDESIYTKYEAESGAQGGGASKAAYGAASGGYNLGTLDNVGAYGQVVVSVPKAGVYEFVQRYSNAMPDTRYKSLYVNSVRVRQFAYPPTNGWTKYAEIRSSITLNTGSNTIKIQRDSADNSATDFDYFLVSKGTQLEWESGTVGGGATFNAYPTASNGLQLGNLDAVGAFGQVSIVAPTAGQYDIGMAYANGMTDSRRKSLYVNGQKVSQMLFPSTGGWTTYAQARATVSLNAGTNQIAIRRDANDDPATDFDYVTVATSARIEAESGTAGGGAIYVAQPSSSNGYQVGVMDAVGAFFEVSAVAAAAGTRDIVLRYANGFGDTRLKSLYVNNVRVAQLSFPPTGGWARFADMVVSNVSLNAGLNKIRVQRDAGDSAGTDFDYVLVP